MRVLVAVLMAALGACSPAPTTSPHPTTPETTGSALPSSSSPSTARVPTPKRSASPTTFSFDVENRASIGVIVSVASDTAATLPGFDPGQRGTISISLRNPQNGISVEIQGTECRLLASAMYPTPSPFTLLVDDGAQAGSVNLSTRAGASSAPIPLPSNSLVGCGG